MTTDALAILERLIGFDTVPTTSNVPCAEYLAGLLDDSGWRVELHRHEGLGAAKANLVAWAGPDLPGGLILSGHMDVVPFADQPGWTGDPLRLRQLDDRLVGRGVADMKGFLALAVDAACRLDPRRLRRPLVLLFTCDEEEGCLGAERLLPELPRLAALGPIPTDCLIGEPTSFEVYRAHKGHVRLRLDIRGVGGHSSRPDLGVNAIAVAATIAQEIEAIAAEMPTRVTDDHRRLFPAFPSIPFNLGTIHGGSADNMIADRCELVVAFRPAPGSDARALLEEVVDRARATASRHSPAAEVLIDDVVITPPMSSPGTGHLIHLLLELTGSANASGAPYATDGGQLERAGIRSLICGPGDLAQAHRPDESITLAALDRGAELLHSVIERTCCLARP